MFTKKQFYDAIKPKAKSWASNFSTTIHFEPHYTLSINISGIESEIVEVDGRQLRKVIVSCQFTNRKSNNTFVDKYVCADLVVDCIAQGIRSDYQLFKHLEKHYRNAISEYVKKFAEWRVE